MTKTNVSSEITLPKNQLKLYGCDYYFNSFIQLYQKNKLPNTILLNGPKGSGKATFAYHFINSVLSENEDYSYDINKLLINPLNRSFRLINKQYHPNFYLIEPFADKQSISIKQVKDMINYLNKTCYEKKN